ncbi:hypothetical protein PIROE2DRAFT_58657 [Piromyces sp. E2]|nr:hypothetical protein PIROE2DRAFT_58657 [Piromyces sp. E2]|eukprot:OUM67613.1 hypothetical protein PIROE2DRAFT_58657 [Piromyces sp. E2]
MNKYGNDHTIGIKNNIVNNNELKLTKFPSCDTLKSGLLTSSINYSTFESKNSTFYPNKAIVPLRLSKSSDNINLLKNNEEIEKNDLSIEEKRIIFANHDEDIDNKICDMCLKRPGNIELLYCHHILCDKCIQNEDLFNKDNIMMKCFCGENVCYMKYIYDNKNLKNSKKENHEISDQSSNKPNPTPTFNGNMYNILTIERIFPVPTTYLPVVKLSNIPWDLSQKDVLAFFYPLKIPAAHEAPYFTQGIHIIMNRTSGKTFSDAYIEFVTIEDANIAIETRNKTILKGRIVTISRSSQEELMKSLFPSWAGNHSKILKEQTTSYTNTSPLPPPTINSATVTMGTGIIYGGLNTTYAKDGCFLTRDENHECPKDIELFIFKADKNMEKREPSTPNQSIISDSVSSAYPSPPNSIKTISSNTSQKEEKNNSNFSTANSFVSSISTQNKLIISSLSTTESNNLVHNEVYNNTTTPVTKNFNENNIGTTTSTTLGSNCNSLNRPMNNNNNNNNNYTIFEDDNKTTPLEFTLTENNDEEKVLIDNISNVLLNNPYDNNSMTNSIQAQTKPGFPYSVVPPPSLISNNISLPTTEMSSTPSITTVAKINENQKTYTPFSSTSIITTTSQSIIPVKTPPPTLPHSPFMMNNQDTSLILPFDPIVNSNVKMNNNISPIDKDNLYNNSLSINDSKKENPSFTPLITSEGLINKNLQNRQNQSLNKIDKDIELKPYSLSTLLESINQDNKYDEMDKINNPFFDTIAKDNIQNNLPSTNFNVNTIQALKCIIQNLNNKCMAYDEKLKEVLEYNKQLETKIMELKKHSIQEEKEDLENSEKEENEKSEYEKPNNEFPSPSLSSLSSSSK